MLQQETLATPWHEGLLLASGLWGRERLAPGPHRLTITVHPKPSITKMESATSTPAGSQVNMGWAGRVLMNWLFAGSPRGCQAAATFFTPIDSARRADLNLWDYTTDLVTRLPAHPINQLEQLLPDNWKPSTN